MSEVALACWAQSRLSKRTMTERQSCTKTQRWPCPCACCKIFPLLLRVTPTTGTFFRDLFVLLHHWGIDLWSQQQCLIECAPPWASWLIDGEARFKVASLLLNSCMGRIRKKRVTSAIVPSPKACCASCAMVAASGFGDVLYAAFSTTDGHPLFAASVASTKLPSRYLGLPMNSTCGPRQWRVWHVANQGTVV